MKLPKINTYCNYSSDNVVRENDWKTTTGKHLNAIDGGDKKNRVTGEEFERLWAEQIESREVATA